ncbi:methylmalonyl-CoA mutase family protein [Metallumcola ferriviriculae]|uniref:Methylmalonyl-CoA mutase family protein n=1 Tax=Metallumcola ferriviriculae TaxID=3039180 RepID=A0AAU0USI8_9FIRM|nr:methylmalonyl-CoA mutase family protein [Desulfitibacteraceae bacterium MK1]
MAKEEILQQKDRWLNDYESELEHSAERCTDSGISVDPLYTPGINSEKEYLERLGFPGKSPFTRGVYSTMYRGRPWTIRQLAGYGTAEDTNERYRMLLKQGSDAINAVFDYPTLRGYDSDNPAVEGDIGQGGVAVDTIEDMLVLFDNIPIDRVSVSLVACNPVMSATIMAMYLAVAESRGISPEKLAGTIQNDFLMETMATTAPDILEPALSFRLSTDIVAYCAEHVPRWNPISYTGYNYRESGANAVQEVGLVMAHAFGTIEEMLSRGYSVDQFVPRLSFFLSSHNDFFEEVAKFRAARRVWFKLMQERYSPKDQRSLRFRYHVQTAGVSLTAQQPLNNISRSAYQALAAVMGGAQSIHVDGFDEALSIPSNLSALTALRTQQILQNETNVTSTIDPLGGSYFVEQLTDQMEQKITQYIDTVANQGGIVKAVETGWVHQEIRRSAYKEQLAIENGTKKVVGVNCFNDCDEEEESVELFRVPETLSRQKARLLKVKETRSLEEVNKALTEVEIVIKSGDNVLPALLAAVKARTTVGEIADVFRSISGSWKMPLY